MLDDLIHKAEIRRRKKATEDAIAAYYDSLTDEERAEEAAWGEFALSQWKEDEP